MCTYNIRDGRRNHLEEASYALLQQNVDIGLLTEAKIPYNNGNPIHTRNCNDYHIFCTYTDGRNQGGLALMWRHDNPKQHWTVESPKRHGPNVLSFLLIHGETRTPVIGAYLPPTNTDDLPHLEAALQRFPKDPPMLLGDLNFDFSKLHTACSQSIHGLLAAYGLEDMLSSFVQNYRYTHRLTWFQHRHQPDGSYKPSVPTALIF